MGSFAMAIIPQHTYFFGDKPQSFFDFLKRHQKHLLILRVADKNVNNYAVFLDLCK